jgi:hypothetical protein
MAQSGWDGARDVLADLDFPATKEQVVGHAQAKGADPAVLKLLRALPPETYRNISEIRSSVRLDPAADEGQTPEVKAQQARKRKPLLAEHLRDPGYVDPEL